MLTVEKENSLSLSEALMQSASDADDKILARFYEWLDQKYSSSEYAKVRADCDGKISPKFFAVCERARRLMPVAKWLSWHKKSNLKTLDLGSGAGHMGLIAGFFGHSAIGIDKSHLFDELRQFWKQPAIVHSIDACMPMPPIGKFHSITSILTNYGRAWTIDEWQDFIDRMIEDHLEPDGELIIHFPGSQILDNRKYLRSRAARLEHDGRFMFFGRN